jgi:hypothetical protein
MARTFVVSAEIVPLTFVISAEIAASPQSILRQKAVPVAQVGSRPLSYGEEVYMTCAPTNARLNQAWDRCVESAEMALICNQVSLACTERAVRHANLARQLLTIARLQGTVPFYKALEVSNPCRLKQAVPSA